MCDYLFKCVVCEGGFEEVFELVGDCFVELNVGVIGFFVLDFRIVVGFVFYRDFFGYCLVDGDIRIVLVIEII